MPQPPRKRPLSRDERLSELLRLKRLERPDAAFWDRFQQDLRSKQLASLVRIHPWNERLGRALFLAAKKAAPATAASCALAVTLFAILKPGFMDKSGPDAPELAAEPSPQPPLFAVQQEPAAAFELPRETALGSQAAPNYQMRVLSKASPRSGYELYAAPPILQAESRESSAEQSALGAKVIDSGHRF